MVVRTISLMGASALVVVVLLMVLWRTGSSPVAGAGASPLVMYCAASNRAVIEEICASYREQTGQAVELQFGASQVLLSSLRISRSGDLFLPADASYLDVAARRGLVTEVWHAASMNVGLAVRPGNPEGIHSLDDLLRPGVRLVQANPDTAAVGKVTREVLRRAGRWSAIDAATVAYKTSVTDAANDVLVGSADVAIVYDAGLHNYPNLEFVPIEALRGARSEVGIGLLASSRQPEAARELARYITDPRHGQQAYRRHGFIIGPTAESETQPPSATPDVEAAD